MTRITDLPGASLKFRANAGVGSFSKKLSSATRLGHLSHLSDNKDSIVKVLKKNEAAWPTAVVFGSASGVWTALLKSGTQSSWIPPAGIEPPLRFWTVIEVWAAPSPADSSALPTAGK